MMNTLASPTISVQSFFSRLRVCLHGDVEPWVGEVTRLFMFFIQVLRLHERPVQLGAGNLPWWGEVLSAFCHVHVNAQGVVTCRAGVR